MTAHPGRKSAKTVNNLSNAYRIQGGGIKTSIHMLDNPTICIVGAGALGGYYGARLAQNKNNVHFLLRSDYDGVKANGWTVESHLGDFKLAPGTFGVWNDAKKMPKADLVIVTLKSTTNYQFEPLIGPLIKDDTAILTLQNGLGNEERLAELFGRHRVLGGIAFTCINRIAPGHIRHTAAGAIRLGEFIAGPTARAARIAELMAAAKIDATMVDDLPRARWEKLCWNVPFNGLGAVLDWATDLVIGTPEGEQFVKDLIEEIVAGARAAGVTMSDGLAQLQIDKTKPMAAYLSSMQVDRREKRELEVEAILGEPLRQGTRAGAKMPRVAALYELAKMVNNTLCKTGR